MGARLYLEIDQNNGIIYSYTSPPIGKHEEEPIKMTTRALHKIIKRTLNKYVNVTHRTIRAVKYYRAARLSEYIRIQS